MCREARISEQSYYRWRKEYGGLQLEQAKRMKELEKENVRLKRLVAELSFEKQVLSRKWRAGVFRWCDCGEMLTRQMFGRSRNVQQFQILR